MKKDIGTESDTFGLCWDRSSPFSQQQLPVEQRKSEFTPMIGNWEFSLFAYPNKIVHMNLRVELEWRHTKQNNSDKS